MLNTTIQTDALELYGTLRKLVNGNPSTDIYDIGFFNDFFLMYFVFFYFL